ncbi:hypothetical protein [Acidisoma sp. 7E03]
MTHIRPHRGERAARACAPHALSIGQSPIAIGPRRIQATTTEMRAEIAALEADWAAESEKAAARSLGNVDRLGARQTWDRATWTRYFAASVECQDLYLPRLRRLYAEVERLEQLGDAEVPSARRAA